MQRATVRTFELLTRRWLQSIVVVPIWEFVDYFKVISSFTSIQLELEIIGGSSTCVTFSDIHLLVRSVMFVSVLFTGHAVVEHRVSLSLKLNCPDSQQVVK